MSSYELTVKELPTVNLDFSKVTEINSKKGAIAALNFLASQLGVETVIRSNSERAHVGLGVKQGNVSVIFETIPGATHSSYTASGGETIEDAAADYLKHNFLQTNYPLHSIKVTKLDEDKINRWFDDPANKGQKQAPHFETLRVFQVKNAPALAA